MNMEQILALLQGRLDRQTLEIYVAREWVRPAVRGTDMQFEDIDVARINLVRHLQHEVLVNDAGIDVVLHLLDQLYSLRRQLADADTPVDALAVEFWENQRI